MLPAWQDDAEVSACPICKRPFTFLFRKHHCRRCGKVICDQCSPHRITLPRQYVVRSPGEALRYRLEATAADAATSGDGEQVSNPALGGGETVRVCNPCVPDPNYGPPPRHLTDEVGSREHVAAEGPGRSEQYRYQGGSEGWSADAYIARQRAEMARQRAQGADQFYHRRSSSNANATANTAATPPLEPRYRTRVTRATSAATADQTERFPGARAPLLLPPTTTSRPIRNTIGEIVPSRASRQLPVGSAPPTFARPDLRPVITSATSPRRHVNRRQPVNEDDECPVCGTQDPPFGPHGESSEARERHVEGCISNRMMLASPSRRPGAHMETQSPISPALPSSATDPHPGVLSTLSFSGLNPAGAQTSSPTAANEGDDDGDNETGVEGMATSASTGPPTTAGASASHAARGGHRMLVYHATEKDAFDDDGEPQECVICFEDFAPGDQMGRLECLCKFHRMCIRSWWESGAQPGAAGGGRWGTCPTHQLHD